VRRRKQNPGPLGFGVKWSDRRLFKTKKDVRTFVLDGENALVDDDDGDTDQAGDIKKETGNLSS